MCKNNEPFVLEKTNPVPCGRLKKWLIRKLGGFTEQKQCIFQPSKDIHKFEFVSRVNLFMPYVGTPMEEKCIKDDIARTVGRGLLDSELVNLWYVDDLARCERVYKVEIYVTKNPDGDFHKNIMKGSEET